MPRRRSVSPEFFKDEDLCSLPFEARLLFQGLWCYADRAGRLEDRPRYLKAEIFPYDRVDVDKMLALLAAPNLGGRPTKVFIRRYIVGERQCIDIPGFVEHQNPHHTERNSKLPSPNGEIPVKPPLNTGDATAGHGSLVSGHGSLVKKTKTLAHHDARGGFDTFWKAYPKKKSKGDAEKGWKALKPTSDLLSTILAAIERAKISPDWTKDGGQYIPHPATWLRAKGWEDEETAPPIPANDNPLGMYADWPSPPAEDFCVHGWGLTPELRVKHGDPPDVECGGCQRDREKAAAP